MFTWLTFWFFLPLVTLPILLVFYTLGVWKRLSVHEPIRLELRQFWLWLRAVGFGLAWTVLLLMFGSAVALISVGSVEGTALPLRVVEVAVSLPLYLAGLIGLGIARFFTYIGAPGLDEFFVPLIWYCGTPLTAVALLIAWALLLALLKRARLRKTATH
jgi:hypothetical protein